MQDYSFLVPIFGGSQTINMNAMDIIHTNFCVVCSRELIGAVVALGTPICAIVHRHCVHMVDYAKGWQHQFPVSSYRDAAMASLVRQRNSPPKGSVALIKRSHE